MSTFLHVVNYFHLDNFQIQKPFHYGFLSFFLSKHNLKMCVYNRACDPQARSLAQQTTSNAESEFLFLYKRDYLMKILFACKPPVAIDGDDLQKKLTFILDKYKKTASRAVSKFISHTQQYKSPLTSSRGLLWFYFYFLLF